MMLSGGDLTRPEVALVVMIHAVGDCIELMSFPEFFHQREQLIFAEVATRAIIADVLRTVHFLGANDFQRNGLLSRESNCVGQLHARKTWRIRDDSQHVRSESLVRCPRQKS